jgi:aspartate carbamoyltransferase catalytic subunit
MKKKSKSINDFKNIKIDDINNIIEKADYFKNKVKSNDLNDKTILKNILKYKKIGLCFFENSTRTKISFEVAANNLGAKTFNLDTQTSSVAKGETVIDTLKVLERYGMDCFVVRHNQSGIINLLDKHFDLPIINAGDGTHNHPTQSLLDFYTLREHFKNFNKLNICIVGDVIHSRVAKSNIELISKFGANISIFSPGTLFPYHLKENGQFKDITFYTNWKDVIANNHVVMLLRIQKERMTGGFLPDSSEYSRFYGVNNNILEQIKNKEIYIMHPGPVNYGLELTQNANDYHRNLILEQVENGIYIRMAVLDYLLT